MKNTETIVVLHAPKEEEEEDNDSQNLVFHNLNLVSFENSVCFSD